MNIIHRFVASNLSAVGDREFGGNAGSGDMQSDGYALDPRGADLSRMQTGNAPLLWQHNTEFMLGSVTSIRSTANGLPFRAKFLPRGVSDLADKKCRELKGGAGYGVSLSFQVEKKELFNPSLGPKAGYRATKWSMLELSLCSVPVDPTAVITERARRAVVGLEAAMNACDRAAAEHRTVGRQHGELADELGRLDQHRQAAGTALRSLKRALEQGPTDDDPYAVGLAGEPFEGCQRAMQGMGRCLKAIGDRHADAMDAHASMQRALREAATAYGTGPVQTSAGLTTGESASDRAIRLRQLTLLELAAPVESRDEEYQRRQRQVTLLELSAATAKWATD